MLFEKSPNQTVRWKRGSMKYFWVLVLVMFAAMEANAKSIEEHILVSYSLVVDQLTNRGFGGPLADEVGRFGLVRQLIEDGQNRKHSVSIVGMSLGGANESVLKELGLKMGETNEAGFTLKKVTSSDGETFYALYGPRANVCSAVAIALLWDKYINQAYTSSFTREQIEAWNKSKEISRKICRNKATAEEIEKYYGELAVPRRKAIEKANRMYSPTAAGAITKIVSDMKDIFEFARF
jgi:hypothetical protein